MFWSIAQVLLLSQICLCRDGTIEESMRTKRVIAYLKDPKSSHKDYSRYERKKVVETFHHIVKKILPPYNPNETDYKELDTSSRLSRKFSRKSKHSNDFDRTSDRKRREIDIPELFGFDVEDGGGSDVLSEFGGYSVKMLDKDDDVPKSSLSPDVMEPYDDVVDNILTDRPRLLQEWTEVKESQPEDLSFKKPSTEPFGTSDIKEGVLGGNQKHTILNRPSTKPFGISSNKDEDLISRRENLILIELSTEQIVTLDYKEDLNNKQEEIILNGLPTEAVGTLNHKEENLSYEQDNIISSGLSVETTVSSDNRERDVSITQDLILNSFSTEPIGTLDYKEDLSGKQEYGILNKLYKEPSGTSYNKKEVINSKQEDLISNSLPTETIETSSTIREDPIGPQDCNSSDTELMQILNDQKDQDESSKTNDIPNSTAESLVMEANACNRTRKRPKFMRKALRNPKHSPKTYVIQIQGKSSPEQVVTSDMDLLRSILLANGSSPDSTPRRELPNKHVDDDSRVLLLWVLGSVVLLGVVVLSRKRSFLSKQ